MGLVRCGHTQVSTYEYEPWENTVPIAFLTSSSQSQGILTTSSIVELNITIMVACMPACASFSRHFLYKYEIISSIKSQLAGSRSSKKKIPKPSKSHSSTTAPSSSDRDPRPGGRYWRIKNAFSNGNGAPQITMDKQQSRMLKTGDFDVIDNDNELISTGPTKRGDIELKEPSLEEGKIAPHDVV